MSKYLKTADDARRLLRGFAAIGELADAFEEVGKLEQQAGELGKQLIDLQAARDKLAEETDSARSVLSDLKKDAAGTVANAREIAQGIIDASKKDAAGMKDKAAAIVAAAVAEAQTIRDALAAEREAHGHTMAEIAAEVADLQAKAEKARAYLAKLQG